MYKYTGIIPTSTCTYEHIRQGELIRTRFSKQLYCSFAISAHRNHYTIIHENKVFAQLWKELVNCIWIHYCYMYMYMWSYKFTCMYIAMYMYMYVALDCTYRDHSNYSSGHKCFFRATFGHPVHTHACTIHVHVHIIIHHVYVTALYVFIQFNTCIIIHVLYIHMYMYIQYIHVRTKRRLNLWER